MRSGASWVLIDTGWPGDGPKIEQAAQTVFGPNSPAAAILLTHEHPDHDGAALQLARRWGCPVHLSKAELPIARRDFAAMKATAMPLDRWLVLPVMQALGRRRREEIFQRASLSSVAVGITPGSPIPGLPGWECVASPGHTVGHVSFFRSSDRVLISGDALVTARIDTVRSLLLRRQGLSGPPWYTTWNAEQAHTSMSALARLRPTVLGGGHGSPLTGPDTADQVAAFVMGSGPVEERAAARGATAQRGTDEPTDPSQGGDVLGGLVRTSDQTIGIRAPAAEVWPWLVQLGRGRAGFYTYTWIENLVGADMANLDRIDPGLQTLNAGDRIWLTPDPYLGKIPGQYWEVEEVQPGRHLVLVQDSPASPQRSRWTLAMRPIGEQVTELSSRTWGEPTHSASGRLVRQFWTLGNRLMVRGMLRGIKRRAERGNTTPQGALVVNRVFIQREPEAVFDYLADLHNELHWNDRLLSVEQLTDGPLREGSRFRVRFAGPVGESMITYHQFDRPNQWRTNSAAPRLQVQFTGTITAVDGGSEVVLSTTLFPRGALAGLRHLVGRTMAASWRHHLATAKRSLEASERPDATRGRDASTPAPV